MTDRLQEIEALHQENLDHLGYCFYCGMSLPCGAREACTVARAAEQDAKDLAEALRNFLIVQFRYANQTGGRPTTDEDMDRVMRGLVDAHDAHAKRVAPEQSQDERNAERRFVNTFETPDPVTAIAKENE